MEANLSNTSNTTSPDNETDAACILSDDLLRMSHVSWYIFYYCVTPLHLIFGLPAHIVSLITFYKQSKQEAGYVYQVGVTVNKILCLITFVIYVITYNWLAGTGPDKALWFTRSYHLMWFTAHMSIALSNTFMNNAVLLSLSVAADRLFAVGVPVAYRTANHRRHRTCAFVICFVISAITNIAHTVELMVIEVEDGYALVWNDEAAEHPLSKIADQSSDAIYILGASLIVICNALVIHFYRKRAKAVTTLTNSNLEKEARRKMHERTLVILTSYESIMVLITSFTVAAFYTTVYANSWFSHCGFVAYQPLEDGMVEIADLLQFYVIFAISKQFRKMVFESVPVLARTAGYSTAVVPVRHGGSGVI